MNICLQLFLADLALGVTAAFLIRRFLFMFVHVKGRSMLDTLHDGDILLAKRYSFASRIERFDVVLCRFPEKNRMYIKRVVALPGERISMEGDTIFINGEPLLEPFERRKCFRKIGETCLGPDEYFVLGDNRPVSVDSRRLGPLKRSHILCRARFVLFPWKNRGRVD